MPCLGRAFILWIFSVNRLSEQADIIPLMISERLIDVTKDYQGCTMEASGQFRSYNRHEGTKNRLVLSVFVREVRFMEEFTDYTKTNQIFLDGYICKEPVYRKTPLGREIADLLVAVNRPYGKSDYIPSLCLGPQCQDTPQDLASEQGSSSGAVSRAGSTRKRSARRSARSVWPMKSPSVSLNVRIMRSRRNTY